MVMDVRLGETWDGSVNLCFPFYMLYVIYYFPIPTVVNLTKFFLYFLKSVTGKRFIYKTNAYCRFVRPVRKAPVVRPGQSVFRANLATRVTRAVLAFLVAAIMKVAPFPNTSVPNSLLHLYCSRVQLKWSGGVGQTFVCATLRNMKNV